MEVPVHVRMAGCIGCDAVAARWSGYGLEVVWHVRLGVVWPFGGFDSVVHGAG